jgi:transposase-like protein
LACKEEEKFENTLKRDVEARVREGVGAVLEEVLEEEMSEHLGVDYLELTPIRRESATVITSATWSLLPARSSA